MHIFEDQLAAGNFLDAIGDPIAFDVGVAPLLWMMPIAALSAGILAAL